MGISPNALYSCLLSDIRAEFPNLELGYGFFPGVSTKEAAAISISNSLLKKLTTGMTDDTKQKALSKFLQINESCENWTLQLEEPLDDLIINELKCLLDDFWHRDGLPLVSDDGECLERGALGPGANIRANGGDFYTKLFSGPLSCTRRYLYWLYKRYIASFPEWANAENIRIQNYGEAHIVEGNRLSFVPKNDEISRSICTEPTLNMFFQLGLGNMLASRLKEFWGINLEDQQFKNRELARRGSVFDNYVTIDLSSASDSMSLKMLKYLLPKSLYDTLVLYRSPSSTLPNGKPVSLNMVSTMGNGYTFPLQTILFSAVVNCAFRVHGIAPLHPRGNDFGNYGVFGDDIICPVEIHRTVLRVLHILGFKANTEKTFVEGPFKESCGSDFFNGVNIRGVYIKDLNTNQDCYSAINQLNLFSTRTGIRLPRTVQYLLKRCKYLPIPREENDDAGIKVPFSIIRAPFRLAKDIQGIMYTCMRPRDLRIRIDESALHIPRSLKRRIYNPSGLLISFLQGSVRHGSIGVRQDTVRYRPKHGATSFWDRPPTVHPLSGWFPWQRWETSVYFNLYG